MTRDQFLTGYRSAYDSEVQLRELRAAADGRLMAMVSFVSNQDATHDPNGQSCPNWTIWRYPKEEGSNLRSDKSFPGSSDSHAC
jgi:hypothetical protein